MARNQKVNPSLRPYHTGGGRISDEEARRLVRLVQAGLTPKEPGAQSNRALARSAEAKLARAYTGLVLHLAAAMAARSPGSFQDLVSAGFEALVRAIRRVDTTNGAPLSGYFGAAVANAVRQEAWGTPSRSEEWYLGIGGTVSLGDGHCTDPETAGPGCQPRLVSLNELAQELGDGFDLQDEVVAALEAERLATALGRLGDEDRSFIGARFGLGGTRPLSRHKLALLVGASHKAVRIREKKLLGRLAAMLGPGR